MSAHVTTSNYAEVARIAFDLWSRLYGGDFPNVQRNSPETQKALLVYQECLKAVSGEKFDVTKLL
jgi:hypothetical protein